MQKNHKSYISLCGKWQLSVAKHGCHKDFSSISDIHNSGLEIISATVPGTVELDLFNAGKVDDLFFGTNPDKIRRETERLHCYYFREFEINSLLPQKELIFEGLDCYADVFVNGIKVGEFDNMLIEQRCDISSAIVKGKNEILVHIRPAVIEALKYDYPFMVSAGRSAHEQLYVRKPAHMYGWDIMPRYISAGIWKPLGISLKTESERIKEYYICTAKANDEQAVLEFYYKTDCEIEGDVRLTLKGICEDSVIDEEIKLIFPIGRRKYTIKNPKLWWPRNFGKQNMYDFELTLSRNGEILDSIKFSQGLAAIRLDNSDLADDSGNGKFLFTVNSKPIFIKGTNWVPASPFHSMDKERIPKMLSLATELDCNMLRCWGGNVYEDELFYEICDREGIMVWQDFGMACSKNPQDDEFAARMAEEATAVVKRLRSHACIALWSGDNESDLRWVRWEGIRMDPSKNRITREVLPHVLMQHDPARSYLPSSPYLSKALFDKPMDDWSKFAPEDHFYIWDGHYKKSVTGKRILFASECGSMGFPSPESVKKYISADNLWPEDKNNPEWLQHATSPIPETRESTFRINVFFEQAANLFEDEPDSISEFAKMSQITQLETNKTIVENFRSAKWNKTGILWWNLIDGWPQFSDASVDYYFDKKLMFYGMKKSQQNLCIMINDTKTNSHNVILCNDTLEKKHIHYSVYDITNDCELASGEVLAPANENLKICSIPKSDKIRFIKIKWWGDANGDNHYFDLIPEKGKFKLSDYMNWLKKSGIYDEWVAKADNWKL